MNSLDENAKLDITCPNCGHKFKKSLGLAQRDFDCPGCGTGFKTDQFAKEIKGVEKSIDKFKRDLRGMFR